MNYNLYSTTSNNIEGNSFNHLTYDLRLLYMKNDTKIKEREDDDINLIIIISFLLKNLYIKKLIKGDNQKIESYNCYKEFYTSNFKSFISYEFFGLIKT